jgi:hypothetical protein
MKEQEVIREFLRLRKSILRQFKGLRRLLKLSLREITKFEKQVEREAKLLQKVKLRRITKQSKGGE